jgi:hypothetical protein
MTLALNSQLRTYQILTNDDQMLILCLSYFITTVPKINWPFTIYHCTYLISTDKTAVVKLGWIGFADPKRPPSIYIFSILLS